MASLVKQIGWKDKHRRSVTFTKENYKIIEEVAIKEKTTISKLINRLIEKEYIENGKTD